MSRTTWRGVTVDQRTADMLDEMLNVLGPLATDFWPSQGSYNTSVSASGGTHSGGGAVDIALYVNGRNLTDNEARQIETAGRCVGFAAYYRTAIAGLWPRHVHMIAVGCPDLSPAAAQQVTDYNKGRDGLLPRNSSGLSINPDTGCRDYVGVTWETCRFGANSSIPHDTNVPQDAPPTSEEDEDMKLIQVNDGKSDTGWVLLNSATGKSTGVSPDEKAACDRVLGYKSNNPQDSLLQVELDRYRDSVARTT